MRRLCASLLVCLAIVPAALAASGAAGDGVLELRDVAGSVTISGKGVLWGQSDKGTLAVFDYSAGDGDVLVSGQDKPVVKQADGSRLYVGRDLHFRITGGTFKLVFTAASGLDLTAVGVGRAWITPDPKSSDDGDYARDSGSWKAVPPSQSTYLSFGKSQPNPPPTTTTAP